MHPSPVSGASRELARTLRLAGPLVGGQLAGVGLNFIDTVMAGKLSAEALAAIALGGSIWASVMLFTSGVLMALPAMVSQLDGAGRRAEAAPLARQALWIGQGLVAVAVVVTAAAPSVLRWLEIEASLAATVVGYMKALCWGMPGYAAYHCLRFLSEGLGATRPTLYFGVVALPLNVVANLGLMYGRFGLPALGAVGCGWATSVVWSLQAVGLAVWVWRHPAYRDLRLFSRLDPPRARPIAEFLRLGLPIGATWLAEVSLFTVAALLIGSLGMLEVAGHQVAINFTALTYMVPLGISMAITVRVGNAVGRRDAAGALRAARTGMSLAVAVQAVWATIMLLAPRAVAGVYTDDARVVARAAELLVLAAIFQFPDGLQVSAVGALRGYKDTRVPLAITLVAYWLIGLPLGHALGFRIGLGARGVWIGLIAGLVAAAAMLLARYRRVSRRPLPELPAPAAGPSG